MGFDPESIFRQMRSRPRVVRRGGPRFSKRRIIAVSLLVFIVVVLLLGRTLLGLRVNFLFFASLGHTNVFWTPFVAQVLLFLVGFAATAALIACNIPGWRAAARNIDESGSKWATWGGIAFAIFAGVIGGGYLAGEWQTVLLFLHGAAFGASDPVFGKDYSFYLFTLPLLDDLQAMAWGITLISLVIALVIAAAAFAAENSPADVPLPLRVPAGRRVGDAVPIAVRHAGMILVPLFLLAALGAHFTVYHMSTSSHTDYNFWGLDATQRNVVRPVLGGLQWVAVALAVLTAVILARRWSRPATSLSGALSGVVIFGVVVSGIAQTVPPLIYGAAYATPNAQSAQLSSISDFLSGSRYAWGLQAGTDVQTKTFSQKVSPPTINDLAADPQTLNNVRLQDYRELPDTLRQIDATRNYQQYPQITVDRYADGKGKDVEVMLGPREINSSDVPSGFVNQNEIYTHGYGITAVSVNQVADSGKPNVLVGQQPMTAIADSAPSSLNFNGSTTADPRIYCGLSTNQDVIVNTNTSGNNAPNEFDYPSGTTDKTSNAGQVSGIPVDNFIDKLALSVVDYGGTDLLLTTTLTPQSQALIHRTISERVQTLAPFLTVDGDPYVVVDPDTNHLMYVADAYVKSSNFPNSYQLSDGTSYMRNAVKAVVDAKTCATTLYATDLNEPITATYNAIYPGLLTPLSSMSPYLRSHLRYPEDLFTNQALVYAQVHVASASVFFNGSDRYRVSQEQIGGKTQDTQPYYVELTLPQDPSASFVLLQTFSPGSGSGSGGSGSANNMTAWLAAESDYTNTNHPKLDAVPLGNGSNILGPLQFDNNLNTNPTISKDISLLNQGGSSVILGNVIVLPFNNDSFLYVRPLYVAAGSGGSSSFPQLQRVLVGKQDAVAEGNNLTQALQALYGTTNPIPGLVTTTTTQPTPTPTPGATPGPTPSTGPTPTPAAQPGESLNAQEVALLNDLLTHTAAADAAFRAGDFATFGKEEAAVQSDATQLRQLLGAAATTTPPTAPTASPSASPH